MIAPAPQFGRTGPASEPAATHYSSPEIFALTPKLTQAQSAVNQMWAGSFALSGPKS